MQKLKKSTLKTYPVAQSKGTKNVTNTETITITK